MERAKIIEMLIDGKWSSKRQFAEHIGVPPTTLQSILKRGVGKASIDNIIKVCRGLGITVDQLERMAQSNLGFVAESSELYNTKDSSYDYYPISVAAGLPEMIDGVLIEDTESITVPNSMMGKWAGNQDVFFMRVNGESMNEIIPHDSLIAVKQLDITNLVDGDIVVYSDDHEYSVKRFYKDEDRIIFRPASTDNRFADYVSSVNNENLKIHGKVVIYNVVCD